MQCRAVRNCRVLLSFVFLYCLMFAVLSVLSSVLSVLSVLLYCLLYCLLLAVLQLLHSIVSAGRAANALIRVQHRSHVCMVFEIIPGQECDKT